MVLFTLPQGWIERGSSIPFLGRVGPRFSSLFVWDLLSAPSGSSRLWIFSAPSVGKMRQKENPGTHCCVVPWILRSQASLPSPLHFPESSCVCLCIVFRFLVILMGIIGKNASSRKWKFFFYSILISTFTLYWGIGRHRMNPRYRHLLGGLGLFSAWPLLYFLPAILL